MVEAHRLLFRSFPDLARLDLPKDQLSAADHAQVSQCVAWGQQNQEMAGI
jgi:hypothetical protein